MPRKVKRQPAQSKPAPKVIPDFRRANLYLAGWKDGAVGRRKNAETMKAALEDREVYDHGYQNGFDDLRLATHRSTTLYTFPTDDAT